MSHINTSNPFDPANKINLLGDPKPDPADFDFYYEYDLAMTRWKRCLPQANELPTI